MAINRISGDILESNLIRSSDLAFNTDILYVDVTNGRIGVKTDSPGNFALDVNGTMRVQGAATITGDLTVQGTTTTIDSQNLVVEDNIITLNENASTATDSGIMIQRAGQDEALFYWDETLDKFRVATTPEDGSTRTDFTNTTLANLQVATPLADADAATKKYIDDEVATLSSSGGIIGTNVTIGTPTDSTFGDGSLTTLGDEASITDAIDSLNETMENIRNSNYVKSVTFVSDTTSISTGDTVTLTISTIGGGADRYTITWGDGEQDVATTDSTPSHTYNSASGSPMTVTVKAFANGAVTDSAGSFATSTRSNYITVAGPAPVVGFNIKSAASGGSTITFADSGSTVYLENTTTNTIADNTFEVDWGDGTTDSIANDSADGGASGSRLAHTYTNSTAADDSSVAGIGPGDTKYRIRLTLLTHGGAAPEVIPQSSDANFEVYSQHTAKIDIADSVTRGVNEESTSGFPVTFINGTDTLPGSNSDFSQTQRYAWDFGEGAAATNVNIGSGGSGDTDQTIANTFNLSSGEQAAGTTVTYDVDLEITNGNTNSTFTSPVTQIIVEPDVRANIAGTAVTVSTGSGDNSLTLYDHTDLDSNVRSLARFTNTSQNADDYVYDYYDDSSSLVTVSEDGASAGSIAATIDKDYTGASTGNINFRFRAHGTPDTIEQDDEETLTFVMKAVPSAPAGLDSKSITLADAAQGTNPHLCAGFDDNTGAAVTLTAGDSLETTVARRYTTTTTIDTSTASNFYDGSTGTLAAEINDSNDGTKTFTTAENETGTFTSLVVSSNVDYDTVDSTYPQRFYLVASAKITKNLSAYSVGVNAQRLTHTTTGVTNYVHVVKDDITATPTTTIGTVTESSAGTYRYISGVPYYNTGFPLLEITGTTVANFTGQAYQDTISPHEVDPGTNQESTSGNVIASNPYSYLDIDNLLSSMLTGPIPNADTGVSSAYTLGTIGVPITDSAVRSIQTIKARSKNANGTGSYSEDTTKIQVYTASLLTLDDEAGGITVADSLGAGFDDDAVRISGFGSLSSDTPSLYDSSNANYYTDHAWSGAVTVAGTNEAISRFGTISHFTTDLSSGYLPVGPDLETGRDGGEAQYYTFAFRRTTMANFNLTMSGKVSGMFIAAPGTAIDSASGLNGWLDCSTTYGGSGVPGSDTGNGGNGSDGCAFNSGDRVIDDQTYSNQEFTFTLGTENATNATGNNILVRIKLNSGDSITALSID